MKRLTIILLLIIPLLLSTSWGFFAHKRINQLAIFTLPMEMLCFYKAGSNYIIEHAVDPDKRRYIDTLEAPRHYLDVENYEKHIDSIPEKWSTALHKYGQKKLNSSGIVPWQIERTYYSLVKAFKNRDSIKILKHSADLGHYIGDAHVPLHTTHNHNGQLTNQAGIHAFWESRIPELFAGNYNLIIGKAVYLESPLKAAWVIVKKSHASVDTVLQFEAELNRSFPADQKYSFSKRGNTILKQYSAAYSKAYQDKMRGMVEKRMRSAILATGSFWYSAWIDAGQPQLRNLVKIALTPEEKKQIALEEKKYSQGKIIGREN
ncbi:zinc dependent phospholipase C family protein [Pedobacter insulae]|uniref:S1/P1 Nuclease n=1 Tax=Pedobacter insulae TaxID=414048 RepID=A0A1I2VP78_9SPHI|nr:zinc dependent phospholipase C family protein [Pedobacter insulae]SFG91068.1 S1/P1 Nuclease [Pedobacter insulae]